MAIHRIVEAGDDFYTGAAGLSDGNLLRSLSVLANDPRGASLYAVHTSVPHALGGVRFGGTTSAPRAQVSILDDGITYTGWASVGAGGRVVLDFRGSDMAIKALGSDDVLTGSFYYTARLAGRKYDLAEVTFTIRGTDDAANITGDTAGVVTEDATLTDFGTVSANDPDAGQNQFQNPAPGALNGTFGTFSFTAATGAWGYTLTNGSPNVQSLGQDDSVEDHLTVTSFDGSDSTTITVVIQGMNDLPDVGGDIGGDVTEDGTLTDSGTLTITDVDAGEAHFQVAPPLQLEGDFGTFTFNENTGAWTYTLDNTDLDVQALLPGDIEFDSMIVTSADGSTGQLVSVTIHGATEPASISGDLNGSVTEDDDLTDSGVVSVSDPDPGEAKFKPATAADLAGAHGTFTFDENLGTWGYSLNNSDPDVQALPGGVIAFDSMPVNSLDGSDSQNIVVTINGKNDPASISGNFTGDVYEDGTLTDSGTVATNDPDTGQGGFQAATANASFGSFTFSTTTGAWTYQLANGSTVVQQLKSNDFFTDTLTVTSFDGSDSDVIEVQIQGADDPATFGGTLFGVVHEDGVGGSTSAFGTATVSDPDLNESDFLPLAITTTYGDFAMSSGGVWSYLLNSSNPLVDGLGDEGQLQDLVTITSTDGSTTQIQIDIFGHFG